MTKIGLAVVVLSAASLAGAAVKADDGLIVGATADFYSKYVWRGQNLVDDWVFQPGVSVAYGGLTASFWGNLDLTDENGSNGQMSEVDLTLDYAGQIPGIDALGYSVGLIHYDFPIRGAGDDTAELYAGVSLDVPANPSVTLYRDVDEVKGGTYISFGIGHSFENVAEIASGVPVGMDVGASLGWGSGSYNKFYWGPNGGELNDLVLSVAFPFEVAGFSVTPSLSYVTLVGDDIRAPNTYRGNDMWFGGVSLSKEF